MGRPLKIKKTTTVDIGFNNLGSLTNPVYPATLTAANFLGVVGGEKTGVASAAYPVVACIVNITGSGSGVENGVIIRQKGSTKYLVQGLTSGAVGVCVLADDATPSAGNMCIQFSTGNDSTLVNLARITNKWALDYNNVRYVANFFSDLGSEIKSGTRGVTNNLAQVESFTTP